MTLKKKIRVLVVDDSLLFRETIARGLAKDDSLEVVGTACDPFAARDMIEELEPDVMTLDVEMPKMGGIEFLRRLMPQYPMPVVVVSSVSHNVFDALNAGAVDFVTKPGPDNSSSMESLIRELGVKVKIASTAKVSHLKKTPQSAPGQTARVGNEKGCGLIAIGASTGGTEAICSLLQNFPREMPPIVIVQHMPPVFTQMFAERLNRCCAMSVNEAVNGVELKPGQAWLAAGDMHMSVKKTGGLLTLESKPGDRVNGHCPSVDVLFNSIAPLQKAGLSTIGILLTGMGYDGAKGLLAMRKAGAMTICQDEESSIVYGMPKVAWDIGAGVKQAPLDKIHELVFAAMQK